MPNSTEKIWAHERQRRNSKLERTSSVLGASLRDKVVSADLAAEAIASRFGRGVVDGRIQAHIVLQTNE